MLFDIIYIIIGIVLVLRGADRLTEGAAALARRMQVPEIIIGLTIVAAGTSAPELFVSLSSALKGSADIAVGNVIGSNILNTLLIVGCAAMVAPIAIARSTVSKDLPLSVAVTILLIILCLDNFSDTDIRGNTVSRTDGIIMLACFAAFMAFTIHTAKRDNAKSNADTADKNNGHELDKSSEPAMPVWKSITLIAVGLLFLIFGSDLFSEYAAKVAGTLGMSDAAIGITIVAGGTSLPELATTVIAARKGQSAMAIGNVLGSNIFNILAILGITSAISPLTITDITMTDLYVMIAGAVTVWLFSFTKYTVSRIEGIFLTASYIGYAAWRLFNA